MLYNINLITTQMVSNVYLQSLQYYLRDSNNPIAGFQGTKKNIYNIYKF